MFCFWEKVSFLKKQKTLLNTLSLNKFNKNILLPLSNLKFLLKKKSLTNLAMLNKVIKILLRNEVSKKNINKST